MPDSTTEAIDRLFDFIDKGVDAADHVFNRGKQTADRHTRRAGRSRGARREVIEAEATVFSGKKAQNRTTSTAIVRKPHFYIVESVHPTTGEMLFIVTDGGNARTECSTRELAAKVLRALSEVP